MPRRIILVAAGLTRTIRYRRPRQVAWYCHKQQFLNPNGALQPENPTIGRVGETGSLKGEELH
jgi:hypothetical protein